MNVWRAGFFLKPVFYSCVQSQNDLGTMVYSNLIHMLCASIYVVHNFFYHNEHLFYKAVLFCLCIWLPVCGPISPLVLICGAEVLSEV